MSLDHVGGRLTSLSQTPVFQSRWNPTLAVETEENESSVLYWAPFYDNEIALITGGAWFDRNALTQPQMNIPEPASGGLPMDIWAYWTGSSVALDFTWWASDTARAVALARNTGVWVKSTDATRRYLGTIAVYKGNGNTGKVYDSPSKRHIFNFYNKIWRKLEKEEDAASWVYNVQAWRQANGASDNIVSIMQGVPDGTIAQVGIDAQYSVSVAGPTNKGLVGITRGAPGTPTVASLIAGCGWVPDALLPTNSYTIDQLDAIGLHTFNWMEFGAASGSTTFYGGKKSGLRGVVWN